jgi:hypothetical protein
VQVLERKHHLGNVKCRHRLREAFVRLRAQQAEELAARAVLALLWPCRIAGVFFRGAGEKGGSVMRITKVKKRLRVRVRVKVSKNANSQQLINRSRNQTMDTFSVNTNENIPVLIMLYY